MSVRALTITGGSKKIFVSGANVKELADMDRSSGTQTVSYVQEVFSKIWLFPKPVFCAINGHAMGGGLELALHCDFRVAVEGARFGQPEIKLGVLPGAGGTQLLPRLIGLSKARWLLLSGQTLNAEEAPHAGWLTAWSRRNRFFRSAERWPVRLPKSRPWPWRLSRRC